MNTLIHKNIYTIKQVKKQAIPRIKIFCLCLKEYNLDFRYETF